VQAVCDAATPSASISAPRNAPQRAMLACHWNMPEHLPTLLSPAHPSLGLCLPGELFVFWRDAVRLRRRGFHAVTLPSLGRYVSRLMARPPKPTSSTLPTHPRRHPHHRAKWYNLGASLHQPAYQKVQPDVQETKDTSASCQILYAGAPWPAVCFAATYNLEPGGPLQVALFITFVVYNSSQRSQAA